MNEPKSKNITWHHGELSLQERRSAMGQHGAVIWFTGLSGSGKSTLARRVESELMATGHAAYVLDGDNVRHGLNKDLGFSPEDRTENIRRIGEVAGLFADSQMLVLTAFISPYREDRAAARAVADGHFVEVHLATPLDVCEERDPKGLYQKARSGEIPSFTGISAPYEEPESPEITIDTAEHDLDASANIVLGFLRDQGYLKA
jgi:adenylylsulfate kinase